jgi:hypothetical protein
MMPFFQNRYLEREVVQSEEILLLRPAMVHLLAHAQGRLVVGGVYTRGCKVYLLL